MAGEGGQPHIGMSIPATAQPALLRLLEREPWSVEFFQAVHALEQIFPDREPVGGFGDPGGEVVRFATEPSLTFPASEIQAFERMGAAPPRLTVNFMGAAGLIGPLPHAYTTLIRDRGRARDRVLRDFLDTFNHRMISLFYLAWEKYHFTVTYKKPYKDRFTLYLMDFVGLGTPGLQKRQEVRDHSLVFYAGLLGLQSRPAAALEQILGDHFGVPVEIEQLIGGWYPLDEDAQCCLHERDVPSRCLGEGAVAGDAIWDHQSRSRAVLGPLKLKMYLRFLPGGGAYEELEGFVRFFSGGQYDMEAQLVLARAEVPDYELGAEEGDALPLGLCSWLGADALEKDPKDAILLLRE